MIQKLKGSQSHFRKDHMIIILELFSWFSLIPDSKPSESIVFGTDNQFTFALISYHPVFADQFERYTKPCLLSLQLSPTIDNINLARWEVKNAPARNFPNLHRISNEIYQIKGVVFEIAPKCRRNFSDQNL